MTKKSKLIISSLALILLLGSFVIGLLLYRLFNPLISNKEGELSATSVSPGGRWKVKVYYIEPGGGATSTPEGGRAEVVDLKNKVQTRNIYFGEPIKQSIRWEDSNTIVLNGHKIDVRTESYEPSKPSIWETLKLIINIVIHMFYPI